jgi:pimeloyl-ACP methyl ester carboxylesterase
MKNYPIIILPGWTLGPKRYYKLKEILDKKGYTTFIINFPGFEEGKKLEKVYYLSDYVKYLKKILHQNKIHQAVFVCHSFGGRVGLKLLSQEPKLATALILSGVPGFVPVSKYKLLIFLLLAKTGGTLFSLPIINKLKNLVRKLYYKMIGARDFYHTEGFMRETFKNVIKENLTEYMRKIRIPTLLLWGENDRTVHLNVAKRMQKYIRDAKLSVVPDAGHMFLNQKPETTINLIEDFLQKI